MDVTFTTVLYQPDWSRTGAIVRDVLGSLEACDLTGEYRRPSVALDQSGERVVFAYGGPDRYGYFLSESSILLLMCTVPLIVTGVGVAALNRRLRRPRSTPPAGS